MHAPPPSFRITGAGLADLDAAVACMAAAFARDPITSFLLEPAAHDPRRLAAFFRLLMRARIALGMPALVARQAAGIAGAAMGYDTAPPPWPDDVARDWDRFERDVPGLADRMAAYAGVAHDATPAVPHHYLGVLATRPGLQGQGVGSALLQAFCALSASDPRSEGVYLETANPENVGFYRRAGFEVVGEGRLGPAPLWCMFLRHARGAGRGPSSSPTGAHDTPPAA